VGAEIRREAERRWEGQRKSVKGRGGEVEKEMVKKRWLMGLVGQ
jgi:hypothetical protein